MRVRSGAVLGAFVSLIVMASAQGCQDSRNGETAVPPTGPRPRPQPVDSITIPPPVVPRSTVISMDSTLLLPGRVLWVRVGLPSEPIPPDWRLTVDDGDVADIRWNGGGVATLTLRRPGTTTVRAASATASLARTLTVQPLPPVYEFSLIDSVAVLGGWSPEGETARQSVAHLRVRDREPTVTLVALLMDAADLHASARCAGPSLDLTSGTRVTVRPSAIDYYNGYRTPEGGLEARLRLILRNWQGQLRLLDASVRTAPGTDAPLNASQPPFWHCE